MPESVLTIGHSLICALCSTEWESHELRFDARRMFLTWLAGRTCRWQHGGVEVLLVEDNEDHVALVRAQLDMAGAGLRVHVAHTLGDALAHLERPDAGADVVVLDLNLPDATGLAGLEALINRPGGAPPVVVLTTLDNERLAHAAVRQGAQDYLSKGSITGASLVRSVAYARNRWVVARKRESLLAELQATVVAQEHDRKELDHRVRNLLSVVQSLASHTAWTTGSADAFVDVFGGRLRQLATVHETLAQRRWQALDMNTLLRSTLGPHLHGSAQLTLTGTTDVTLRAKVVRPLALALHELYTNAIKHGALATPAAGSVHVEVQRDGENNIILLWQERRSAAPVGAPANSGRQGLALVANLIERELGGRVKITLKDAGLQARFDVSDAIHVQPAEVLQPPHSDHS